MKPVSQGSPPRAGGAALLVAIGILSSRVAGLVRSRVFSHYFGLQSDAADAFNAAFRIPNFLQNLFGEGVLSGSFIPVYAALVARGERKEADRVAGAVGALLALGIALIVLVGILATPQLVTAIAAGFEGQKRDLTIQIVRILFPGAGLLVLSAWCLGILNSHHKFLLSYIAPVMWNVAMIATLLWFGGQTDLQRLAVVLAWGSVVGSLLQFMVQLPAVLRVAPHLRLALDVASVRVREISRNFVPVFIARGVVQLSAFIDTLIASLLPTGAVTGLANAQLLYTLPVSLFGMSVSAAELPVMAGVAATNAGYETIRGRLDSGMRRMAFFVVPSSVAFLALGDVIAAALFQTGRFGYNDAVYVWGILAGYAVGLMASTLGRLYSSGFYALKDTRTPFRCALIRVTLATSIGYFCAIHLPGWLGVDRSWGAAGLTVAAGAAGWVEMILLRNALNSRIGTTGLPANYVIKLWSAAIVSAAAGWAVKLNTPLVHPIVFAALVLGAFGAVFFTVTWFLGVPEAASLFNRLTRRK